MKKILAIFVVGSMFIVQAFALPKSLVPIGRTAGITIMYEGVLVAGISQVDSPNGLISPSEDADIKTGDFIKEINGEKVNSNENIVDIITKSDGEILDILIFRNNEEILKQITPALDKIDGFYKIGIWVRDSMAGIGTITYIDPQTSVYGGLGHSISDSDTGEALNISKGNLIPSTVENVAKGEVGKAGELQANYDPKEQIGTININSNQGIFGTTTSDYFDTSKALDVADFSEITTGTAYLLSNVDGEDVKLYEISVLSIVDNKEDKNFIIEIIDKELIGITGGIVQGMSGSPIIQNDKIIGAVTHVFLNNPQCGYGIYIGNMLEIAENVA